MSIAAGHRMGPYEVRSTLGAGGMGEVYRARDTRLGRDVALKVLPTERSNDPERLRRFEREARAVAALDHPHILALHDLGTEDGVSYVVFELVEGQTLREKLERGALPVRKCAEWGVQICRGLAGAHARGIVHRDLKPENISITPDGRVKILDFGLAKVTGLTEPKGPENAETRTATESGFVIGTVGYMSPEQVRGQAADARSDIFSLGAVLYEMLTGQRAFRAATPADTISAILHKDPPEMATGSGPVPPGLERLVRRCLEKDPDARFQSASDLAFALEALALGSHAGTEPASPTVRPRRLWLSVGIAAPALAAAAGIGLLLARTLPDRPLPRIQQLTFRRGTVDWARFTPDGKTIVYSAYWDGKPPEIFTTRVESRESRSLGLPPARLLGVSSRGELAILLTRPGDLDVFGTGTLARVSLSGGEPRKVLDDVWAADWSPDGRELAVLRLVFGEDYRLEYPIGHVIARNLGPSRLRISPRGDRIAMNGDQVRIYNLTDGKVTALPVRRGGGSGATLPVIGLAWDGDDALWVDAGDEDTSASSASASTASIWRVTLDGKAREVYRTLGGVGLVHDALGGRLLMHHGFEREGVKAKPSSATRESEVGVFSWSFAGALSNDGKQFLINEAPGSDLGVTFMGFANGSPPVRLGEGHALALSPDGTWALLKQAANALTLVPTGPDFRVSCPRAGMSRAGAGSWTIVA